MDGCLDLLAHHLSDRRQSETLSPPSEDGRQSAMSSYFEMPSDAEPPSCPFPSHARSAPLACQPAAHHNQRNSSEFYPASGPSGDQHYLSTSVPALGFLPLSPMKSGAVNRTTSAYSYSHSAFSEAANASNKEVSRSYTLGSILRRTSMYRPGTTTHDNAGPASFAGFTSTGFAKTSEVGFTASASEAADHSAFSSARSSMDGEPPGGGLARVSLMSAAAAAAARGDISSYYEHTVA